MNPQGELDFSGGQAEDGFTHWQAQRKLALLELARALNLPLNHQVEVWLPGGIRLRGKLLLQEEKLFLPVNGAEQVRLEVDHVPFFMHEMESCVRLD